MLLIRKKKKRKVISIVSKRKCVCMMLSQIIVIIIIIIIVRWWWWGLSKIIKQYSLNTNTTKVLNESITNQQTKEKRERIHNWEVSLTFPHHHASRDLLHNRSSIRVPFRGPFPPLPTLLVKITRKTQNENLLRVHTTRANYARARTNSAQTMLYVTRERDVQFLKTFADGILF